KIRDRDKPCRVRIRIWTAAGPFERPEKVSVLGGDANNPRHSAEAARDGLILQRNLAGVTLRPLRIENVHNSLATIFGGTVVSGRRDSIDDLLDGLSESDVGRVVDGVCGNAQEQDERQLHRIPALPAPCSYR